MTGGSSGANGFSIFVSGLTGDISHVYRRIAGGQKRECEDKGEGLSPWEGGGTGEGAALPGGRRGDPWAGPVCTKHRGQGSGWDRCGLGLMEHIWSQRVKEDLPETHTSVDEMTRCQK